MLFSKPKSIGNFKSKVLSILSLFNLNKADSVSILNILEKLDPEYQHIVNLKKFASTYCGEFDETFLFIYEKFYLLIDDNKTKKIYIIPENTTNDSDNSDDDIDLDISKKIDDTLSNKLSVKNSNKMKKTAFDEFMKVIPDTYSYSLFLRFFLLFMSIPDSQMIIWLYWLVFKSQDIAVDQKLLEDLIDKLWGNKLINSKKYEKFIKTNKLKAESMLVILDSKDLTPSKLRILDTNAISIWTKPILLLRKTIRSKTLGYFFWNRIIPILYLAQSNIEQSYQLIKDNYKLTKFNKTNFKLVGERKFARKDIRKFIRLHLTYIKMPLDNTDMNKDFHHHNDNEEDNISDDSIDDSNPIQKISSLLNNTFHNIFKSNNNKVIQPINNNIKQENHIPLDILYKDSLKVPLQTIYNRTNEAKLKAKDLISLCENEIDYSHYVQQELLKKQNIPISRRTVIVDVSSSSSSSDVEENHDEKDDYESDYDNNSYDNQNNISIAVPIVPILKGIMKK